MKGGGRGDPNFMDIENIEAKQSENKWKLFTGG